MDDRNQSPQSGGSGLRPANDTACLALADGNIVTAGYVHIKVGGGRFGWWECVLRRGREVVWFGDHKHKDRGMALACSRNLVAAINGELEPLRFRND